MTDSLPGKTLILVFALCASHVVLGQYWFGPKIGLNYIDPVYQDPAFERDLYSVDNDFDFNGGVAFMYTATDLYSVYSELIYERMNRDLRSKPENGNGVVGRSVNQFLTIPIMLRMTLGRVPFHYFINGGPKISYWLASKGELELPSFDEQVILDPVTGEALEEIPPYEYRVVFNSKKANGNDKLLLSSPNRIQFGLVVGAGAYFDLASDARLMMDFKVFFGHSNLGFDQEGSDFQFTDDDYVESFEFTTTTLSASVAYLFGYNAQFKRRGRSTNKESNKKKRRR